MYDKKLRKILTASLETWGEFKPGNPTGGEMLDEDGLRIKNWPFSKNYGSNDLESSLEMIRDMNKKNKICQVYFMNPGGKCHICYFGWLEPLDRDFKCSFDRLLMPLIQGDKKKRDETRNKVVERYFEKIRGLTNYNSLSTLKQILLEDLNELRQK